MDTEFPKIHRTIFKHIRSHHNDKMVFSDNWINEFLFHSAKNDKKNVRNMASAQYRRINDIH